MAAQPQLRPGAIRLRPETDGDEPFLLGLYAAIRWAELEPLGLDDARRRAFLDDQFSLQRAHYRGHYPGGDFSIVELDGEAVGRLYLFRTGREHRIVDLALAPAWSGQGIGGRLLDQVLDEAGRAGRIVSIHVEAFNPARRLYLRKGFSDVEQRGPYWLMEWAPVSVS